SERPGLVGYAVVKGSATEIVDIAHFLPRAYADWFRRRDPRPLPAMRRIMLVDDSAFFRDMLAPLIKAAGYHVTSAASAAERLPSDDGGDSGDRAIRHGLDRRDRARTPGRLPRFRRQVRPRRVDRGD